MKIVVLDGYTLNPGDLSWEELEQYGELTVYDRTSLDDEKEIIQRIRDLSLIHIFSQKDLTKLYLIL